VVAIAFAVSASEGAAQPAGPLVPAITPEQVKASEALAATHDQSAAREKVRLEMFKNRPLASVIQKAFDVNANYLMMAARMMPESAYGFRPTPELRTFGEQINHATAAQYSFCNQAGMPPGVERRAPPALRQLTAKADIIKALDDSVAYCDRVLAAASEAWLMEIAPRLGGASSGLIDGIRAHAFMYNNVHDAEDYGTITVYMRLQGMVPPSSARHQAAPPK
jgi:DinB superfamily